MNEWNLITLKSQHAKQVMMHDIAKGEARFKLLMEKNPNDGMIYFQRGQAYENLGIYEKAISDFRHAEKSFPIDTWEERARSAANRLENILYRTRSNIQDSQEIDLPLIKTVQKNAPFNKTIWDEYQEDVICQPNCLRMLVNAGPGTGKTAVACARVSYLVDQEGIAPSKIWLISFTRTAVKEMVNRIGTYLKDPADSFSIKIATLDSQAWAIHSGFNSQAKLVSHDTNIDELLKLMQEESGIGEYLSSLEHLVVDEAQDIVGRRKDLVLAIIDRLNDQCGVTVFSDEAQAIYGFSLDENSDESIPDSENQPLPAILREKHAQKFSEKFLKKIYRTASPNLLKIFTTGRDLVLQTDCDIDQKFKTLKKQITENSDGRCPQIKEQTLSPDVFILFRRRADVLVASSFLNCQPHRLRMSGFPTRIAPWIGICLGEHIEKILERQEFMLLWKSFMRTEPGASLDPEESWRKLIRIAGKTATTVDMATLRKKLGASQPPTDVCLPEIGDHGPIIGTIHGCKGREAEEVRLMMPPNPGKNQDLEEETRVLFVGASRAKNKLLIGEGYKSYSSYLQKKGRIYSKKKSSFPNSVNAQVMIGCEGDITSEEVAGMKSFLSTEDVKKAQKLIATLNGGIFPARAEADHKESNHPYRIMAEDGSCIGTFSQKVNDDMFRIGEKIQNTPSMSKIRPPDAIEHLFIFGLRTIVIPPDSHEADLLHPPWSQSGIMLAPVVIGYPTVYFKNFRGRY